MRFFLLSVYNKIFYICICMFMELSVVNILTQFTFLIKSKWKYLLMYSIVTILF